MVYPRFRFSHSAFLVLALFSIVGVSAFAQNGPDKSGNSLGLFASKDASAKDVGLPVYPGAKPAKKDESGDSSANIGFWAGDTGFKLVVLKLESEDPATKIIAYYRNALSRYGKVLQCDGTKSGTVQHDSNSKELTCDDKHDENGTVLKAGSKDNQHIVGIETKGEKRAIQLIYLLAQESDNRI